MDTKSDSQHRRGLESGKRDFVTARVWLWSLRRSGALINRQELCSREGLVEVDV